ncbi:hypothetical protein R6Q57_001638 [Mikania cordata]
MSFRTGHFTFSEIKLATKNFDESLVIGRGGFGKVYRGAVTCGGNALLGVAIKRLDSDSSQGPINKPSTYVNTLPSRLNPTEYFQTSRLTRKSDVYAFGVVLFEVLCGKRSIDRSIDEEHWGLETWAQDSIKEGRLKQIVDPNLREIISLKCLKEFALVADRCLHSRPKQRPTMTEVVMGLESILALQETPDSTLLMKFFRTKVPTSMSPPNPENSVGGTSLESLDIYLYTVGGEHRIVRRFDFNTILYATQRMHGDVPMYKGRLQNGQDITIAEYSYARAYKQCMNEASFLVRLEHENVIQLLGYCIERTKVYLLYDLSLNATLAGLIYDLDWNKRYKIILGVARVLVYLHNHALIRIIHREVTL